MNQNSKRLVPLLLVVLLAGCGKGKSPVAPIVVPPLSSLSLSPAADTLAVGETVQFVASAIDTAGVPFTGPLVWSTSDAGVAVVTGAGFVRAVGEGSALVFVRGGGLADSARVLVFPAALGWTFQTSNASENLNGVFVDPAGRLGWVVGDGGLVLSTMDAGITWTRRLPTTFNLNGVWFTSASEGWAVGDAGTVLHTIDGGASWARMTNTNASENLLHVHFASPDTGWAVGSNGVLLGTFDGGGSWTRIHPTSQILRGVMFAGPADGWAVGEGGVILGTHDAGRTWFIVQPFVTAQALRSVWRDDVARAVAVGAQGVAPRTVTTPDSVAWVLDNAGASNELEGVCFRGITGWAVGWNGAGLILRSDDGGATWHNQIANAQFRLRAVYFVDDRRGWAVGSGGIIRHTGSGGE